MRKNDLIKLLQNVKGNPEILLWNGLVEDWMHVNSKLTESTLVKRTKEHLIDSVRLEECCRREDFGYKLSQEEIEACEKQHKRESWSVGEFVDQKAIKQKKYKTKRVVYIQPTLRGERYFDRQGSIRY